MDIQSFQLVMQVPGFIWSHIRGIAEALMGEKMAKALETTFDIFMIIIRDLKTMIMDAIMNLLQVEVVQAGIKWLLGLLTPAGAFPKACNAIIDIVKWFINNGSRLTDLVSGIVDSIADIAAGNLGGATKRVEDSLKCVIPLTLGFLAGVLGIGDLSKRVQGSIRKVTDPIKKFNMIDANEFKIKNQNQRKIKAFPESELNKLVGKLPEGILDFLKQEGECTFNRDFLWTVLPDQFHDALNEWGLDGNNCFVFMRSSFDSLLYFYQGNFYALNSMRGSINCLNDDIDDVFNLYMCMPLILKTNFWRGLHLDNENNLPSLADDEMYTLVPSIPSGGSPEVSKIEVVKMLPYSVKLSVSYDHQATQ